MTCEKVKSEYSESSDEGGPLFEEFSGRKDKDLFVKALGTDPYPELFATVEHHPEDEIQDLQRAWLDSRDSDFSELAKRPILEDGILKLEITEFEQVSYLVQRRVSQNNFSNMVRS